MTDLTRNYRRHKSLVTRRRNRADWPGVIAACEAALASFDAHGWPDDWAHFRREADDARCKLRFG